MKRAIMVFVMAVAAIGCGDGGTADTTTPPATTAAPTTTAAATTAAPATGAPTTAAPTTTAAPSPTRTFTGADGVEVDVSDTSRIVSLNGDVTEILFELGMGSNVVAIDVTTTYPEAATALPVVGFGQMLTPEGVLAFSPTLVIGDEQIGPPETIQQLRDAGIPVVILETQTTLEGVSEKIAQIAEIAAVADVGAELAARVEGEIAAAQALVPSVDESPKVAYIYVRGPQTLFLFGAGMPTQAMIEGAGAIDSGASTGVFGPAPLTPEALIAAAPEYIVLPAAGVGALGGIDAVLDLPGVRETPAASEGNFLVYDEAYFFNLGPRTGIALEEFIGDLYPGLG